jgi:hypothetical protein
MKNSDGTPVPGTYPRQKFFFFKSRSRYKNKNSSILHVRMTFVCARAASTSSGLVMSVGANRQLAPATTLLIISHVIKINVHFKEMDILFMAVKIKKV